MAPSSSVSWTKSRNGESAPCSVWTSQGLHEALVPSSSCSTRAGQLGLFSCKVTASRPPRCIANWSSWVPENCRPSKLGSFGGVCWATSTSPRIGSTCHSLSRSDSFGTDWRSARIQIRRSGRALPRPSRRFAGSRRRRSPLERWLNKVLSCHIAIVSKALSDGQRRRRNESSTSSAVRVWPAPTSTDAVACSDRLKDE